jgi:GNAT superfamily N-acetyltransferase
MPARAKAKTAAPPDPDKLRRETAGRYVTGDGRFTVEQGSNGWSVLDAEQTDDFGLPLMRGPYPTLDGARGAIADARSGPAPTSDLAERRPPKAVEPTTDRSSRRGREPKPAPEPEPEPEPAPPPPVDVRAFRQADGDGLRELWTAVDFRTTGDDDDGLRTFAKRNPGLFLVAHQGETIVGSAMGGWDGRRGWIYHVAVTPEHRRTGLATQMVRDIEARLRVLGCWKVNVMVRGGNDDGEGFWAALGYERSDAHQYARELHED